MLSYRTAAPACMPGLHPGMQSIFYTMAAHSQHNARQTELRQSAGARHIPGSPHMHTQAFVSMSRTGLEGVLHLQSLARLSRPKRAQMARSMKRVGSHMGASQFLGQSGVTT